MGSQRTCVCACGETMLGKLEDKSVDSKAYWYRMEINFMRDMAPVFLFVDLSKG
jgi:hypothetical protein